MRRQVWLGHLAAADEDRRVAEVLIDVFPRSAAFHAQQAAEKLVRALLLAEGVDLSRVASRHSIAELVRLIPADNEFRHELSTITHLEQFATAFRYPTPTGRLKGVSDVPGLRRSLDTVTRLLSELTTYLERVSKP